MDKVFGVPIDTFLTVTVALFCVCIAGIFLSALRNRVLFKVAVRNIPRRPAQTALILFGLMLAAMLFSASFSTGDTISHSIRTIAISSLGEVDIIIESELETAGDRTAYFSQTYFEQIQQALEDEEKVEGVAPAILEVVPVVAMDSQLNEPAVYLLGFDPEYMEAFDQLKDAAGRNLPLDDLTSGQVYVSTEMAEDLRVAIGDDIHIFLGAEPDVLSVANIYEEGGKPAEDISMVMPLPELQSLLGRDGQITSVIITNKGDATGGEVHTDAVMDVLESPLELIGLSADPVKQDLLDQAEEAGTIFSSIFLLLGQFSIAAGILLIFLIFVMLAAERRSELGIARALGTQRRHVIRMFTYEGVLYALIASAIGSVLGLMVGWGMVRIMAVAFMEMDFDLAYYFNPASLAIAYTLGVLLTLIVVAISSWRVSNLNIICAIKDIPEPARVVQESIRSLIGKIFGHKLLFGLLPVVWIRLNYKLRWKFLTIRLIGWESIAAQFKLTIRLSLFVLPLLGLAVAALGIYQEQATIYLMGGSLVIVGLSMLARRFGLPDRAAFTIVGVGLLVFWLLPDHPFVGEMEQGMELFFLSGIMVMAGSVWVVMYNSDLILSALIAIFGRFQGPAPILKTALAYPMSSRFRTGMALAMFSLVVFTLVVMSLVNHSMSALFDDYESVSGGFDIMAMVNPNNPITDIDAALIKAEGIDPGDFESIAGLSGAMIEMRQAYSEQDWSEDGIFLQGVDSNYTEAISYEFSMMAEEYDSADDVWQALSNEPNVAVISPMLVPSRVNYSMGGPSVDFQLEGFYIGDEQLPDVYIGARHPVTGKVRLLRVIGVLETTAVYAAPVTTSQDTLNGFLPVPMSPTTLLFATRDGADVSELAKDLESSFLAHGMDTIVVAEQIDDQNKVGNIFDYLIQGFMGLGLIVGIAALGVIAARAVVERRQQIGMLRAIGFQRSMVQFAFLLESSFVALLGITIGMILGYAVSSQVVADMSETFEGATLVVPWGRMIAIAVIAYTASLLTTYLPARQAARVYPAEALRYE